MLGQKEWRWAMLAGSCSNLNMVFSLVVGCYLTAVTVTLTHFSERMLQEDIFQGLLL
jgi:hypothetical protein